MNISVILPWRSGDPGRERSLEYVRRRYADEHPSWQVVIGEVDPSLPWAKAAAIRVGLEKATGSLLVLADADVWTDGVARAVDRVKGGVASWAVPHTQVVRLDQRMTTLVLNGQDFRPSGLDRRPYTGIVGGGITVIRRELYEEAPLDSRFVGWGHEDEAAGHMWRCLAGQPWRGRAKLWHLWHPAQPKLSPAIGSRESKDLLNRYRSAAYDPRQMRRLIAEGLEVVES